ncbi:MBL fold metallo-hydrolase [Sphingomonas sp. MAH-20]|uniref:MBL fold metallo-hydrolase n=1 Tax=Sphingomonas horti TaxID=2682842 RepID=A0A6I4J156_9SPHN|nr:MULTISPECIES: MBL fold metallo-hydrolase [Sphingomonas]MBA2919931.1 MBL fold metallo-hydrolase [Sphingomonas sp. CGMCC 1.13658]MVO77813.1 MBL fold metallo-hydrolase [Sphingomonas horti]
MLALALLLAAAAPDWQLIPGSFERGRGPDGNTVLLDAPDGLVVVDTGRHQAHQDAILAAARARGKPVAAIVNTHWHLDHTGGNAALRAAFPGIPIYASNAVDGALTGFFPRSRAGAEQFIASGKAKPEQVAEIRRDMAAMDDLADLRPSRVVARTGTMTIAGRRLDVHLERYAATAGDVWLYDPQARLAIAGDLVVGLAPFMDTACPEGWRTALGHIAAAPFKALVPGHGAVMSRADFDSWRKAFDALLDCAAGSVGRQACIEGWMKDAAPFIPAADKDRVPGMIGYYIDTRLRAAPDEKARYCPGGPG